MSEFESDTSEKNQESSAESGKELVAPKELALPEQILPPNLLVIPQSGPIVFPSLMAPLTIQLPRYVRSAEESIEGTRVIGLLLTREEPVKEELKLSDLYDVGVACKIIKRIKLPDGSINLLVHGMRRFKVSRTLAESPHMVIEPKYLKDEVEKTTELDALTRNVIADVKNLSEVNPFFTEEMRMAMINAPGPGTVADLVAFALALSKEDAQEFLETLSVTKRFEKLLLHLRKERDVANLQRKIQDDVNSKINSMQREFFLKEQLKVIRKELGTSDDPKTKTSKTLRERILEAGMPEEAQKVALEELEKFETTPESSPEYNIARNYLDTLIALPWSVETKDQLDIRRAQRILDKDHYGLEKVKERIIEFLAVRKLKSKKESPKGAVICLVGPPGVGKTSIGRSIAETLGRKFYRFSLGGMRDEAEIKGHRRTYVGAMPGKVISAVKRAGAKNAAIMLDEIDKLGQSFQGDPASALLEVLDPEQNFSFLDHYLDVPFDLSNILFICTANTTSSIPAPLLDRMEVIEIPGYTLEEKAEIANQYVIPQILKQTGVLASQLKIPKSTLKNLISDYAREPGLRSLQKMIERIARKAATKIVKGSSTRRKPKKKVITILSKDLNQWLGPKRFHNDLAERIVQPGVVVGLAWTATGGDILFIEATDLPGSGQLKLTGSLGEVMIESANIGWSYVKRKLAEEIGLNTKDFNRKDVHVHIPAGAIPKDGPSAGITMATALYSLFSGRISKQKIAMTGELSLTGKVLPVGGIKEKLLAAKRAGITSVVLPQGNEKDMSEVPKYVRKGLTIHFAREISEVWDHVLTGKIKEGLSDRSKRLARSKFKEISSTVTPLSG